jgi:hypothetical protein
MSSWFALDASPGKEAGADATDEEMNMQCAEMPWSNEDRARDEAMHGCKLGTRCPLFFMALN